MNDEPRRFTVHGEGITNQSSANPVARRLEVTGIIADAFQRVLPGEAIPVREDRTTDIDVERVAAWFDISGGSREAHRRMAREVLSLVFGGES